MKKYSELSNKKKYMLLFLLIVVFLSLIGIIIEIKNPDNYKTKIECGNKTIIMNGTGYNLEDYCPEAFYNKPKFNVSLVDI